MTTQVNHVRIRAETTDAWAKATSAIEKLAAYNDVASLPTIVQKIAIRARLAVGDLDKKYEAMMRNIDAIESENAAVESTICKNLLYRRIYFVGEFLRPVFDTHLR